MDLAIQCWVLNQCKVKWNRAFIIHVNRECTFPNLDDLFVRADVTSSVNDILSDIGGDIEKLQKIVRAKIVPSKEIGKHCEVPYECGFKAHCWKHVPDFSVFDIPGGWRLFSKGKLRLEDVTPKDLTPTQKLPFDVATKNYTHIDSKGIKRDIAKLKFPMYHLDFETYGAAIPRYPGVGPYENVPFQFSLHIQHELNGKLDHKEYLHADTSDPRRSIAEKLVEWIPKKGGIVVAFNASFEEGVLRNLAEQFPKLAAHLNAIADRLVDPHPIIKANVYHKNFRGSFSMKDVAPALLGERWDYSKLEVSDGKAAQVAYDMMLRGKLTSKERETIKSQLIEYCAQDTLAMVELVKWLHDNT
ncbi:MAG: DUF2779 domain-containing protein [Bdellovibrionales bacterium]|nr:DUF2779 domain-containing protein [Bdellovibrionales bacterium]